MRSLWWIQYRILGFISAGPLFWGVSDRVQHYRPTLLEFTLASTFVMCLCLYNVFHIFDVCSSIWIPKYVYFSWVIKHIFYLSLCNFLMYYFLHTLQLYCSDTEERMIEKSTDQKQRHVHFILLYFSAYV